MMSCGLIFFGSQSPMSPFWGQLSAPVLVPTKSEPCAFMSMHLLFAGASLSRLADVKTALLSKVFSVVILARSEVGRVLQFPVTWPKDDVLVLSRKLPFLILSRSALGDDNHECDPTTAGEAHPKSLASQSWSIVKSSVKSWS